MVDVRFTNEEIRVIREALLYYKTAWTDVEEPKMTTIVKTADNILSSLTKNENRSLIQMLVSADAFIHFRSSGLKPKYEISKTGYNTGRVAHTITLNEVILHFEDHDKIVSFTSI